MSGGAGRQARPIAWIQYYNASNQNLAGAAGGVLNIALATDAESLLNNIFDKPTTTQFRALRACTVRVSYGMTVDSNNNNEGYESFVRLNGSTKINRSRSGSKARANGNEPSQTNRTFNYNLNANDYIELCIEKLEGNTLTVSTRGTMLLMEIIALR
jgi:hypothetical protein